MMRILLRLLSWIDALWFFGRATRRGFRATDLTIPGTSIHGGETSFASINGIDWPEFAGLGHSFWRAQELTLFRSHAHFFTVPAADLGCGDGVFAHMAEFPARTIGFDYDPSSLRAAASLGCYSEVICADATMLPIGEDMCAVFLSNSVLEHLPDLSRTLSEIYRCLAPGGRFICTLTLGEFSNQLRHLTGDRDADHWLHSFGHIQQPETSEFLELLTGKGFLIEKAIAYQPKEITAIYRCLLSPVFQFCERRFRLHRSTRLRALLARRLRATLYATRPGNGACLFFVAIKPA
jgi:SAM-dependent methyltransferase